MTRPSVGFIGRRRTGKDTCAAHLVTLRGYVRVSFADAVREAALALDPIIVGITPVARLSTVVDLHGWEQAKDQFPEVRRTLQRMGTEAGREIHGENIWVERAMKAIGLLHDFGRPVAVPDVRFPNEAEALHRAGFVLVRLERPAARNDEVDGHASETATDDLPSDVTIRNDGTIPSLLAQLERALYTVHPEEAA